MKDHTIKPLTLLAIAMGMVMLIFFDVVFLKASLQPSNINPHIFVPDNWRTQSIFPILNQKTFAFTGYGDLGASAWQSEPARYLMARNFREGESPYWNPYSASGTIGPETLVDIKFSPFTIISAYFFDASPESFDYGLLIIYTLGSFFVLLILNHSLQLRLLASIAGVAVYLLNGFALPNLNSHMGLPYFFSPLLLYSLLLFSQRQTIIRGVFIAISHAIILSITFLPTLLLVLLTTHLLNCAYFFQKKPPIKEVATYFVLLGTAVSVGTMLIAFLWFPIIDSFFVTDMLSSYNSRGIQQPREMSSLLSIFTPKHFWQNYSGIFPEAIYPQAGLEKRVEVISHTGIFALLIASYALSSESLKSNKVVAASVFIFIFSYARVFGLIPFIDYIPIVRSIGLQYLGCASAITLIILVAHGTENISSKKISSVPALIVLSLMVFSFSKLLMTLGFVKIFPYSQYIKIILYQFFIAGMIIFLIQKSDEDNRFFASAMLAIMVLELMFYMNTLRPLRYNPVQNEPEFVSYIKEYANDSRVLSIGMNRTLYPEYGAMFGIKQLDTLNPGLLPWYADFYKRHFGSDAWIFLVMGSTAEDGGVILKEKILTESALDIANVKYILVVNNAVYYINFFKEKNYPVVFQKDDLTIFENTDHLQTATLLPSLIQVSQIPETADFNPAISVTSDDATLISQAQQLGIPVVLNTVQNNHAPQGTTKVVSYHNTEIVLEAESEQAAVLAISEVWHPNWKATVDGQPAYLGRVNEAFRGIALPAGPHKIRMYYDSAALRYGIYTSIAAVLVLLSILTLSFIKPSGRSSA